MAYVTSNPPRLVNQSIAGLREWHYTSTDPSTTVDGAGYFTNGYFLGMRVGDLVKVLDNDSTNLQWTSHSVVTSNATTGAVDLSDGVSIGGAANAD